MINLGESVDEQVYRIARTIWNIDPGNRPDEFKNGSVYKNLCAVVELAIAEEREACELACMAVKQKFADRFPPNSADDLKAAGARACVIAIVKRDIAAPKDEEIDVHDYTLMGDYIDRSETK